MYIAEGNIGAPFLNQRYRLLRELGSGSMGKVCLVEDAREDNQVVALKLLRDDAVSAYAYTAFKNEFQAMTTFHHPNVVEVFDFGTLVKTQENFFTLEYVKGESLLAACKQATEETLFRYTLQIGRALEYIHAQGFIHFDLKPDNIMVDDEGVVKVMDFGLVEQASFARPNILKGTVHYLAPELLREEAVDWRADLYSFGAVLFHVLSGRTLFGGTVDEVIHQHLHQEPDFRRAPSSARAIPEAWVPLLARLLQKDPARRPASASEFLSEMLRLRPAHLPEVFSSGHADVLGSRSVGRDRELTQLKRLFQSRIFEESRGGPATVLITGVSGLGKSRLLDELRHHAQLRRVPFFRGTCLQHGGRPYLPFAEIIRCLVHDLVNAAGPIEPSDALLPIEGSDTFPTLPFLTTNVSEPKGMGTDGDAGNRRQVKALLRTHAAALFHLVGDETSLFAWIGEKTPFPLVERKKKWLIDSLCQFLLDVSSLQPLVLYCSDLHWADELTLELFTSLARRLSEGPHPEGRLLLCGCYRPDEPSSASVESLFDPLVNSTVAVRMDLKPLRPNEVATMLSAMLGPIDRADRVAELLHSQTRGNPLFIELTVHNLLQEGALIRREHGWVLQTPEAGTASPDRLDAFSALRRRTDVLSENEILLLRMLSVFNRPVRVGMLADACALSAVEVRRMLPSLRKAHFLARGWADGGHQYALRHDALREHIYETIPKEAVARLHGAAGQALERYDFGSTRYLEDLAQHFRLARDLGKVIHYAHAAAERAKRLYDYKRAAAFYLNAEEAHRLLGADLAVSLAEVSAYSPSIKHLDRLRAALRLAEETQDTARLRRVQTTIGRMYYALGRHREAIASLRPLFEPDGASIAMPSARPDALVGLASFFLGEFEPARLHLEKAIETLRNMPGFEEEVSHAMGMCGVAQAYLGQLHKGQKLITESLSWASSVNHQTRWAVGHIYMGSVLAHYGAWDDAKRWLDEGLRLCRNTGDVIGLGTGSSFRGWVALAEGKVEEAIELCRFGLQHISRAGGTWTFSMLGAHLAEALIANRNDEEAAQVIARSLPVVEAGERWGESPLCIAQSRVCLLQNRPSEAKQWAERAVSVALSQKAKPFEAKARQMLANCLLQEREGPLAEAELSKASALFDSLGMKAPLFQMEFTR